jgi:hypothetical protein
MYYQDISKKKKERKTWRRGSSLPGCIVIEGLFKRDDSGFS